MSGTACIGKSSLATQLAERLNLSSVLKTGIVSELVYSILNDGVSNEEGIENVTNPLKYTHFTSEDQLIDHYRKECKLVRRGLEAEFKKCFKEGKSIIVEGMHLNPELYSDMILQSRQPVHISLDDMEQIREAALMDELPKTSSVGSIVISFLLILEDKKTHQEVVEHWVRNHGDSLRDLGATQSERVSKSLTSFERIQQFLIQNCGEFKIVKVDPKSLNTTLDFMHRTVLEYMQSIFEKSTAL